MAYGTLKDYAPRLGLYPSYKAPRYLGKDIEFAYFEFRVPHLWRDILKDPDNASLRIELAFFLLFGGMISLHFQSMPLWKRATKMKPLSSSNVECQCAS